MATNTEVKNRIIQEASKLFFHEGIRAITMDSVANHLGMSKRTIYEYFADKDTLLAACIAYHHEKGLQEWNAIGLESHNILEIFCKYMASTTEHVLKMGVDMMKEIKKYHHKVYETTFLSYENQRDCLTYQAIEQGIKEGFFMPDVKVPIVSVMLKKHFEIFLSPDSNLFSQYSLKEIHDNCMMIILRGICTEKGITEMQKCLKKYESMK